MKKALLSGQKIEKSFGENKVLNGIDIDIYPEDFTVIMGASGSGKSTLLYMLSGMDKVSSGKISYKENDITSASEKEMTRLRADDFGFVFQRTHLVSNLTLYENIVLAGYISGKITEEESVSRANELIEKMNLKDSSTRLPSAVSGGEAQRAAVARAVISKPELLFADEPTGALNKSNTDEVLNLFTDLNSHGQTILLVTHDKEAALRGNRILYIEDGAVIGELSLEPYQGRNKQREDKLSEWLESLRW
ncbi:MAG: ATP-binding cassette domain-containing protein [Oscillospiraceae bacterium]|nr:ATP-binding cassette domain-containing protein [Oscillospiraceae bacterium]